MLKCLNLEHTIQNVSSCNTEYNVLPLMKYLRKFHYFLKVKNETLHNWHSHNSYLLLHIIIVKTYYPPLSLLGPVS
jgi:hypothetical protein